MENKGCAFEIRGGGISRYYASPEVMGLGDFVRFLYENRANEAGAPRPVRTRIPQTAELSEAEWHDIADNKETGYSCFFIVDIPENQLWVNEDTGAGMALYCFPFKAVMEAAASGTGDIWERLLARFPHARMDGV